MYDFVDQPIDIGVSLELLPEYLETTGDKGRYGRTRRLKFGPDEGSELVPSSGKIV